MDWSSFFWGIGVGALGTVVVFLGALFFSMYRRRGSSNFWG